MKNETVVKSVGEIQPDSSNDADYLPVGTQIISFFGERADTDNAQDVFTGLVAEGLITEVLLCQEHCYGVDFPLGVSVFLSPADLAESKYYQVIRRISARFRPQGPRNENGLFVDGECYFDVTENLLNGWSLHDIQHWQDGDHNIWLLLGNLTDDEGSHVAKVTDSIRAFFGVSGLTDITEEMLLVKRAECNSKAGEPVGNFYNVHMYAVVRVKVPVIEARDHPDAIKKAECFTDLHSMFRKGDRMEFADEIDCFLVDEIGDVDHSKSCWYHKDGITPLDKGPTTAPLLQPYKVWLVESLENAGSVVFGCMAEDIHHAIEQASIAYPSNKLVGAMLQQS